VGRWIVKRLAPDSNPIEIATLGAKRDEARLVHAMGVETANVHLGSPAGAKAALTDVRRRHARWLHHAAKAMAQITEREWQEYRAR
jgi:sugar phosphate isomerase/epimerase